MRKLLAILTLGFCSIALPSHSASHTEEYEGVLAEQIIFYAHKNNNILSSGIQSGVIDFAGRELLHLKAVFVVSCFENKCGKNDKRELINGIFFCKVGEFGEFFCARDLD